MQNFDFEPGSFKVLYVYSINDGLHDGRLKVGDATYHTSKSIEEIISECKSDGNLHTSEEIKKAAKNRIDQQTYTADVHYELEAAYLAVRPDPKNAGQYSIFRDYDIHTVLTRSGISKKFARPDKRSGEWFEVSLDQVKKAVRSFQNGESSFREDSNSEIVLRDEQNAAVAATLRHFSGGTYKAPKEFLWNAIMRFGKTLTSYALIKKMEPEVKRVLIMTHRPVVLAGWSEDFDKSFSKDSGWSFGSKKSREEWDSIQHKEKFVYFASVQDLRGSWDESVSDDFDAAIVSDSSKTSEPSLKKNAELFASEFDLVIIDESHEGLKTELAATVRSAIKTKYWLHLSGTPFNIISDFDADSVFTWSYIDEQEASAQWVADKRKWEEGEDDAPKYYPGDANPYGNLPRLEIRACDVSEVLNGAGAVRADETTFNFAKFFEVDTTVKKVGKFSEGFYDFADPAAVAQLLNRISASDEYGKIDEASGVAKINHRGYPFSRSNSKRDFAHTFWVLPSVPSAIALKEMLHEHSFFSDFEVINATGDNAGVDALASVQEAIKKHPRTITLSVGKLTTGTTIPEWTGVFMLSNMSTPMLYMQTIFRVKSSGVMEDGRVKEVGYVFDFAPDRSLEMVRGAARATLRRDSEISIEDFDEDAEEREAVEQLLKYLPIISYDGAKFDTTDTSKLMQKLQEVYIAQVANSGMVDAKLYSHAINSLSEKDLEIFAKAPEILGKSVVGESKKKITVSKSALTAANKATLKAGKPPKNAPTAEQKAFEEAEKNKRLDRDNATNMIKYLNAISVRIPLLVFASETDFEITVDSFPKIMDDESWIEFMPRGFTKDGEGLSWTNLKKFYNQDIFDGVCKEIKNRVKRMDGLSILDRVAAVANLFSTFRSPDKETILTPWSVVNRQYADTLGGLRFVDNAGNWYCKDAQGASKIVSYSDYLDSQSRTHPLILDPQWTEVDEDLQKFWNSPETSILDVNSKTALYPLFGAASLFYIQKNMIEESFRNDGIPYKRKVNEESLWRKVIEEQIYVNCRVAYSRSIAERVLGGYSGAKVNSSVIDIIEVRKVLETTKLEKLTASGAIAKKKRNLDPNEKADIWKWIFNPKSLNTATERANEVLTSENLEEIVKVARDTTNAAESFSCMVSNPPYQAETSDRNDLEHATVTNIFHEFQLVAMSISRMTSMIYPGGRWIQKSGKGLKEFSERLLNDPGLKILNVYSNNDERPEEKLFKDVKIHDGLSVVLWDKNFNNNGHFTMNGVSVQAPGNELLPSDPKDIAIVERARSFAGKENLHFVSSRNFLQKLYSIESNFAELNPNLVQRAIEGSPAPLKMIDPIRLFTNDKAGPGGKPVWFWTERANIKTSLEKINRFQVVCPSAVRSAYGEIPISLISIGEAHGRSRLSIADFPTEAEAKNFQKYMRSTLIQKLLLASTDSGLSGFGSFVPDLNDYTESNPNIDWSSPLDPQLFNLFQLSEDEIYTINA